MLDLSRETGCCAAKRCDSWSLQEREKVRGGLTHLPALKSLPWLSPRLHPQPFTRRATACPKALGASSKARLALTGPELPHLLIHSSSWKQSMTCITPHTLPRRCPKELQKRPERAREHVMSKKETFVRQYSSLHHCPFQAGSIHTAPNSSPWHLALLGCLSPKFQGHSSNTAVHNLLSNFFFF